MIENREQQIKSAFEIIAYGCSDELEAALIQDFPELCESEDERIRKELIEKVGCIIPEDGEYNDDGLISPAYYKRIERYRAYLEKQKEQKLAIMKPHKGDGRNPYDMGVSEAQEYAIKRGFGIPFNDGEVFVDERYITQTIGNILRWADEHPKEQNPAEWSEEDIKKIRSEEYTKGFNDAAFGYKQEWSEEDEDMIQDIIDELDSMDARVVLLENGEEYYSEDHGKQVAWLKSLRPQPYWKPSEEQIRRLNNVIVTDSGIWGVETKRAMMSLYEDLKKLM